VFKRLVSTVSLVVLGLAVSANGGEWLYDFYDGDPSAPWTGGKSPADPSFGADNWIAPSSGYPGGGVKWPYLPTPPWGNAIMWHPGTEWRVLGSLYGTYKGSQIYSTVMMHWAPHTRQNNAAFSYHIPTTAKWFELEFYGAPGPNPGQSYSKADEGHHNPDGFPSTGYAGYGSMSLFGLINAAGAVETFFGTSQAYWSAANVANTMSKSSNWSTFDDRTHLANAWFGSAAASGTHTYKLHVDLDGTYGSSGTGTMYVDGVADPSLTDKDMGLTSHPSTWTGLFFMVTGANDAIVDDFLIRAPPPVPEPASLSLVAISALGMLAARRKRK